MKSSIWVLLRKRNITSVKKKHSMKWKITMRSSTQPIVWSRFCLRRKKPGWTQNRSHSVMVWLLTSLFIESTWREIQGWNCAELGAKIRVMPQQPPNLPHLRLKTEETSSLKGSTIAIEKIFLETKQSFRIKNWLIARINYLRVNFASDWTSPKKTQMREISTKYQVYMLRSRLKSKVNLWKHMTFQWSYHLQLNPLGRTRD